MIFLYHADSDLGVSMIGADRETGTARIKREIERWLNQACYPGDAWRREERLKTIAGGAVSFSPPPTPKPSTTSRTGRGGGCKPAYGTLGQETRRGHWSADSRRVGSFPTDRQWGTDDGGTRHWRRSAEYTETGGEEADRTKIERRRARGYWMSKEPG